MAMQVAESRVYRSRNAIVGGVCAGIADRYDLDPIVVRVLAVLIACMTFGLGAIAYIILWVNLPRRSEMDVPYEVVPESAESSAFGSVDHATGLADGDSRKYGTSGLSMVGRLAIAVGLMLLFLFVAMNIAPMVPGTEWWQFWPIGLLLVGLCLIIVPIPTSHAVAWHALGIVTLSFAATMLPMSLDIISWSSFAYAFSYAWLLVAAGMSLFAIGFSRNIGALMVSGAFCVVAFCVIALTACALPGALDALTFQMPDGHLLRIAINGT